MKKSLNLIILSHAYVYSAYRAKIEALSEYHDLNITLITPEFGLEGGGQKVYAEQYEGKQYHHIILSGYFTGKLNFFVFKNLKSTLQSLNPDIILLEEEYWTQIAAQVTYITKKFLPHTKLILLSCENMCHIWEKEAETLYQKFRYTSFHFIEKYVISKLDGLIFQLPGVWQDFENLIDGLGFKGKRGTLPQLGVDYNRFAHNSPQLQSIRVDLGLDDNTFVYGYIGRIIPEKGIEDMIYAFEGWNKDNTKLIIIGNGDTEYVNQIKQLVQTLKLDDIVIFKNAIPFEEIPAYFQLFNISLLLSHTTPIWKEQFGRVLVESMAAGTPVIGSDSGAIPLVIEDTGYIVLEQNISAIRQALIEAFENKKKYKLLSKSSQARAKKEFSYQAIAKQTYDFIQEIYK
jgi:glycosyltransferase involved in cell wall biosynthesis